MVTTPSPSEVPPIVYVACAPGQAGDPELTVDLRQTRDGQLALLAYTALDRLVDCCGPEQPWAVMPTADLEQIRLATGFELILLDLEIPPEHRRRAEVS
ncbi:SAV_915 family protein [Actinoplanes solisilvae]|uniref:SAV_915 family protein n=1 Tax=Actinoplanes solisilvae TaxID=2486853 RepID=UPI001F0BC1CC|nr:SAV_915 family protein [Actinoplanes solisilvae]